MEFLNGDNAIAHWITVDSEKNHSHPVTKISTNQQVIVEATGWVRNAKGEVILTANPNNAKPYTWSQATNCAMVKS